MDRATPKSDAESAVFEDYSMKLNYHPVTQQWEAHNDRCMHAAELHNFLYCLSIHICRRGRPKFDITREKVEFLTSMSFTWTQIAGMLGISHMTEGSIQAN